MAGIYRVSHNICYHFERVLFYYLVVSNRFYGIKLLVNIFN